MVTLQDVINEIMRIREAIDMIEVKGNQNASYVCYAYGKCGELIEALSETAKQIQMQQASENQNGIEIEPEPEILRTEVGEEIGN